MYKRLGGKWKRRGSGRTHREMGCTFSSVNLWLLNPDIWLIKCDTLSPDNEAWLTSVMFSEATELSKFWVVHPLAKASSETGPLQLADEQSTAETHKTLNWPSWYQTIPLPWLTCGLAGFEVLISKVAHIGATADALHVDQLGAEHGTSDLTQRKHPSASCFPPRVWGVPHSTKHPFMHKVPSRDPYLRKAAGLYFITH